MKLVKSKEKHREVKSFDIFDNILSETLKRYLSRLPKSAEKVKRLQKHKITKQILCATRVESETVNLQVKRLKQSVC